MVDAEIGRGEVAVAGMVDAFATCITHLRAFCVDVKDGEQQHGHEYSQ